MNQETLRQVNSYCYSSYRDTIMVQAFLADHNIPFSYTDTISNSEVRFILDVVREIDEKKNSV